MSTTTNVKSIPILFSGPMVRALISGKKSVTRRVVLPSNSTVLGYPAKRYWPYLLFDHAEPRAKASIMALICGGYDKAPPDPHLSVPFRHPDDTPQDDVTELPWYRVRPKWEVGMHLWVRETFRPSSLVDDMGISRAIEYRADGAKIRQPRDLVCSLRGGVGGDWRPSIFLPRWASRITLEVVSVRCERLNSITEEDVQAEGCTGSPWGPGADAILFPTFWDQINGKRPGCSWADNPWVYSVRLSVIQGTNT